MIETVQIAGKSISTQVMVEEFVVVFTLLHVPHLLRMTVYPMTGQLCNGDCQVIIKLISSDVLLIFIRLMLDGGGRGPIFV